ncbi:MAG: hypothetical protein IJD13_00795 [Oscillospiraceae bacterium]|nr:hypothetical protein [Oscillospiraceae bacterium]
MGRRRKITREKVIDAIASIAFDDIGRYLSYTTDEEGKTSLKVKDSACVDTRNIQEVTVGRDGRLTFKLYSRERALYRLVDLVEPDDHQASGEFIKALQQSFDGEELF